VAHFSEGYCAYSGGTWTLEGVTKTSEFPKRAGFDTVGMLGQK